MYFQKVALDFSILQSRCLYFSSEIGLLPLSTENTSQEGLDGEQHQKKPPVNVFFIISLVCQVVDFTPKPSVAPLMPKGKSSEIPARHSMSSLSCCILPSQSFNTMYWVGHPPAGPIDLCVPNLPRIPESSPPGRLIIPSRVWSENPRLPWPLLFWAPPIPRGAPCPWTLLL